MPQDLRLFHGGVGSMKDLFNKKADEHREAQMENPFSEWEGAGRVRRLSKEDEGYGRPLPGSESERRSEAAKAHIMMDIRYLCDMIWDCAEFKNPDGRAAISFGRLFKLYLSISDKVVGTLLRARKHGFVQFDGEMLYQRRDDEKVIELTRPINTIRARFGQKPVLRGGEVEEWGALQEDTTPVRRNSTPGGAARRLSLCGDDLKPPDSHRGRRFSAPHATRSLTASPERLLDLCAAMSIGDTQIQNTDTHNNNNETSNHNKETENSRDTRESETQEKQRNENQESDETQEKENQRNNDNGKQDRETETWKQEGDATEDGKQKHDRDTTENIYGKQSEVVFGEPPVPPDRTTSKENQESFSSVIPTVSISCEETMGSTASTGDVGRVRDSPRTQRCYLEPDNESKRRRSRSSTPTPMDTIPEDTPANPPVKEFSWWD